jgi:hypothetical protein
MLHEVRILLSVSALFLFAITPPAQGDTPNACDLNGDGVVNKTDVDLAVNMSLGQVAPCTANIMGPGVCNAIVVQRVINASLGGACLVSGSSATSAHSVTLNWVASTSANVAGYSVYRGSTTGGPYTVLTPTPVPGTSYVDATVESGKTYFYVVTAVDTSNVASGYSNEASAVILTP